MQAFAILDYPSETKKMLLTPQREVSVELVIVRDNGQPASFMGYRVQHDDSRGPFKVCPLFLFATEQTNPCIAPRLHFSWPSFHV